MQPLRRKLFRDLMHMSGQVAAICLVIASGMATFVMSLSTLRSLERTQAVYYERYQFAQVFAGLKRAPKAVAQQLREIPGVAQVQTRVVVDVTLDVPGLIEPAVGRLISLPDRGEPILNQLYLRLGHYPEAGEQALVSEAFADAHQLQLGDQVRAVINGRLAKLTIVGVALSPEYVLQMREGETLPDPDRFGIFWMREDELGPAYDMEGAFNNVTLTLSPDAREQEVIDRLDALLERYGGIGAYGREDQLSHRFLSDEIKQLRAMGVIAPTIFLSVAAFLLNVVLVRLIGTQREQIATLKAFGYSNIDVGWHYLQMVLVIIGIGVGLGIGLGAWMGRGLTQLYTEFYYFPIFHYYLTADVVLIASVIAVVAALIGTFGAVRQAVRLPPAEAMRPEPPASFRPTIVERFGLQRLLSESARMILRQLERRPFKAMMSAFGLALAVAVLVLGRFGNDALDYIIEVQFRQAQRQDMMVTLTEPTRGDVAYEFQRLTGVIDAEVFRSVPVQMRHGHRSHRTAILGLEADAALFRLIDADAHHVSIPPEGLVLSAKLAELLNVQPGEAVTVEVRTEKRPVWQLPVARLVDDFAGTNAYLNINALRRLMQEQATVSGAFLRVDPAAQTRLYRELKQTPRVAAVTVKQAMLKSFTETIAGNQQMLQTFNITFAVIIAFGVVYNTIRISLAERSRELATLRVIGFTRAEVSLVLLGELAVLVAIAIPIGLLLGYGFAAMASLALQTEMYRIPLVVSRSTFGFAAMVVIVAAFLSGLVVRRKIDRLNLVNVLKSRE